MKPQLYQQLSLNVDFSPKISKCLLEDIGIFMRELYSLH